MSMLGSSEGFFSSGRTIDCLKMDGKIPVRREELMMDVSAGRRTSRHSTSNGTGRGSRAHDLGAELVITRLTFGDRPKTIEGRFRLPDVLRERRGRCRSLSV